MFHRMWALALALPLLWLSAGCGNRETGPRLANPDDPRLKEIKPVGVGGPSNKGPAPVSTPSTPPAKAVAQ
jgi:hypothetical protein